MNDPLVQSEPGWRLDWLTPVRCRLILALVLGFGLVSHLFFLTNNCPYDLAGDEAHYWLWSRKLDLAYYSKPPMVALIMRASTEIFGNEMWAVRLPALLFAIGTSLCTYWLVKTLFESERLALGTVLLTHTVPLFIAGSIIMTIDAPFYFFWALTTCFCVQAWTSERRWAWIALGVTAALGNLSKYAMPIWFVGLLTFLALDRRSRRWLRSPWPYVSFLICLTSFIAPLIWNIQHDWVTFKHVSTQTGFKSSGVRWLGPFEMIGTQAGVVGPILAVVIVMAILPSARNRLGNRVRERLFLLCIGSGIFIFVLLDSLITKVQPNWPAPAYFTFVPLGAWWIAQKLQFKHSWKPVRGFFWTHVAIGLFAMNYMHSSDRLYPLWKSLGVDFRRFDSQLVKMRGPAEFGEAVGRALESSAPNTFVLGPNYMDSSQLKFYTPGRPTVYNVGPFLSPGHRSRLSQFDIWPETDLTSKDLIGRDAIFIGRLDEEGAIRAMFDEVEELSEVKIVRRGVEVRSKRMYRLHNFHGVVRDGPVSN
ncbi:MAG TPA: glycosyltransferase family 39 protein [Tepidisphaeraceae bacterium]|nr:glycosyltransferase family 39 protein [Tepidisphaeraceae bacterium]